MSTRELRREYDRPDTIAYRNVYTYNDGTVYEGGARLKLSRALEIARRTMTNPATIVLVETQQRPDETLPWVTTHRTVSEGRAALAWRIVQDVQSA